MKRLQCRTAAGNATNGEYQSNVVGILQRELEELVTSEYLLEPQYTEKLRQMPRRDLSILVGRFSLTSLASNLHNDAGICCRVRSVRRADISQLVNSQKNRYYWVIRNSLLAAMCR